MIICGDFNIDALSGSRTFSKSLLTFIQTHNFLQPISSATDLSPHLNQSLICFLSLEIHESAVLDDAFSDHLPISLSIKWRKLASPLPLVRKSMYKSEPNLTLPQSHHISSPTRNNLKPVIHWRYWSHLSLPSWRRKTSGEQSI